MKAEYKYINFKVTRELPKTKVWNIFNNRTGAVLGGVAWYPAWRQYTFYSFKEAIWNKDCLLDVVDFLKQLKES